MPEIVCEIVQHTNDHYGHGTSTIVVQENTCQSQPTKKNSDQIVQLLRVALGESFY